MLLRGLRETLAVGVTMMSVVVVLAVPAEAAVGSADPSLISRYFPTVGVSTVATDSTSSYSYQWTYWQTAARIKMLRDSNRDAYEHDLELLTGSGCWSSGYDRRYWDSNYPYSYLDTDFQDPSYPTNRGGGSAYSNHLATGRWYYHWLRLKAKCDGSMWYRLASQDSHRDFGCDTGSWQWCVQSDPGNPRDIVPSNAMLYTGQKIRYYYQRLYNDGFEDGASGWTLKATSGYTPYWRTVTSTGALDRQRFMTFNCKNSPGCQIYQYANSEVTSDDLWTAEVAVRCAPSVASASGCWMSLALSGYGINAAEHVSRSIHVPNDGKWHIYGHRASQFVAHSRMRFMVTNDSTNNTLDVDLTTLHRSDRF